MAIEARPVDPRDVTSEVDTPTFRVYFWRASPGLACREYELTGADVDEVIDWADANKGAAETYTVGVLTSRPEPHGMEVILTRIKGSDASRSADDDSGTPATERR